MKSVPPPVPRPPATGAVKRGSLVLVATPIGNLGDLPPRAAAALATADIVACEDTRRTRKLLTHAGISGKRMVAVHEHNEAAQVPGLLASLAQGASIALVSDAGMPCVSDPGARLVAAAIEAGFALSVAPGPSAVIAALVVSGLPTDRWCFEGFLPRAGKLRKARIAAVAAERRTTVLYEAPHRLASTLGELAGACGGERRVVVARELTKLHEEVWRGTLAGAEERASQAPPRGEHTLVLEGAPEPVPGAGALSDEEVEASLEMLVGSFLAAGRPIGEAAALAGAELGLPRRRAYDAALRVRAAGGTPGRFGDCGC